MIPTSGDEPLTNTLVNAASSLFRNHSSTSSSWKGGPRAPGQIEQPGDFAGGAWFPNLVQGSQNVLAEMTPRILLHRRRKSFQTTT
jgi:hypothetical protein